MNDPVANQRRTQRLRMITTILLFAFIGIVCINVSPASAQATTCPPQGRGYWTTHAGNWPATSLTLGTITYSQAQVLAILNTPPRGDASLILADQLVAARLSIAAGTDSTPVMVTIADANRLLGAAPIPQNVRTSSALGKRMVAAAAILDSYNNGLLTIACGRIEPAHFTPGTDILVASQTIGPTGGTITIANSGTPLDGSKIFFPVGALAASTQVQVSSNSGRLAPVVGVFPGAALIIDVNGIHSFNQPVSITVPYTGGSNYVPVPYFADSTGTLRPLQTLSIDRQGGTFTFQTFHASVFTWIWGTLFPTQNVVSIGYLPPNDGFQIVNSGSTFNREGECFGMTSFSLWFGLRAKSVLGNLYPKYYNIVGTDSAGTSIRGQNVIATRAFTSITQKWTVYNKTVIREMALRPAERYASIHNTIQLTLAPVLVYLYHSNGTEGAHSVLAYAIDNTAQISIYDPNKPGTVQIIQYSTANQDFQPYCNEKCYDGVVYNGDGSLNLTEPYTNILADAENNFDNSGGATIDLTSHGDGQMVSSLSQTLAGVVHSGQLLVTKLTAIVGSTEYSTNVGLNDSFSIPIALTSGVNHIKFRSEGENFEGVLVQTSNNFDTRDFTLEAVSAPNVITEFAVGGVFGTSVITAGPDGNLWYTESFVNRIGRVTPAGSITKFTLPAGSGSPFGITAGPDGNLWYAGGGRIGRITPGGTGTVFVANVNQHWITAGSDGNLWFTGFNGIGRITPAGSITEFALPAGFGPPSVITAGPGGNLWFTGTEGSRIGRITPASGSITEFALPAGSFPFGITAGPDGNLWFTKIHGIGRITPGGSITEFARPADRQPLLITAGPDGNLWFTEQEGIRRITPAGSITEFARPNNSLGPLFGITAGPDGNLWFTVYQGVGRITP